MTGTGGRIRRATLISGTPNPTALALLRQLTGETVTTIAGVFVEDVSLLRAAALPRTQEVGRVSGILHPLDLTVVETALRREAKSLRAEVAALATEMQRTWSFDIARGDVATAALGLAAHSRVAVLQALAHAPADEAHGAVAVLSEPEGDEQLLAVAIALSNAGRRRLEVYLPPASMPASARLRDRLARDATMPARIVPCADPVSSLARRWFCGPSRVLVLPTATLMATTDGIDGLLRTYGLSVLLLD